MFFVKKEVLAEISKLANQHMPLPSMAQPDMDRIQVDTLKHELQAH